MKTKTFLFLTIILFSVSCKYGHSTKEALNYYENILKNYVGIKKDIEELGTKTKKYALEAIKENNGKMDSIKLTELKKLNFSIIKNIHIAEKNISAIPEFNSKTNIKSASLKYLDENFNIVQGPISFFINIFDDGHITEAESKKMSEAAESISKMDLVGNEFSNVQLEFYKEFNITNDQLIELYKKYGL